MIYFLNFVRKTRQILRPASKSGHPTHVEAHMA